MSEELQNDGITIVEDSQPEVTETVNENPEQGSELAPETPEVIETEEEKQAKVTNAFNKQYGKTKAAERKAEELAAEVARLKAESIKIPQDVGQMPNELDYDTNEEFSQAQTQYLNNYRAKVEYDASLKQQQQIQQQNEYEATQQRNAKIATDLEAYTKNATKNAISPEELQKAAATVSSYGISQDIELAILADENGPLITKYLAGNPQEVEKLSGLSPIQAGVYLATSIQSKAVKLKPKTSNTPEPTTNLTGGSLKPDDEYPNLKGVTFS
jgi:hypothetical protein